WSEDTIDQRLDLIETLKAYTIEGSYAEFKEHSKGMLKEGYLADIVILSERIDQVPTNEISKIKVINTIIDGNIVYSRD
ncbi:MAG: amidohydrolase family protein, partial [Paracoccaceae bacterium]|nr:amidohydrolase family protein [Paracoccaceae bacterium]